MRAQTLALVAMLVAVSTGTGQIVGPAEVAVRPGQKNITIEVTANADDADYTVLGTLEIIREYSRETGILRLRVIGPAAGEQAYIFVTGVKDGKLIRPVYRCWVYVVGPQPVPPGPAPPIPVPPDPKPPDPKPPEPIPPPVVDPLVKSFRDAAYTDSLPLAKLRDLADAFTAAGVMASRSGTTVGQLQDSLTSEIIKRVGPLKEKYPALRKAIQDAVAPMDPVIPPDKREPELTESQREYAAKVFKHIASAALEASK